MDQKKVNERIAMALLMQCAIVWEHCTKLDRKVTSCELKFADVWNGTGDYKMWKKCPTGQIEVDLDKCEHLDVLIRRMKATDGVEDFRYDGRWTMVKLFVQTDDRDPSMGFGCGYPLDSVFDVARDFCMMNACQSLLNKTVFGMDGNGKWARLPEVKTDGKSKAATKKAKPKAKAAKEAAEHQPSSISHQPSFAEQLREALLKHYKADEGKREKTKTTTTLVYKFSQLHQLNDEFDRVFGIGFKPFYNGLVSVTSKHLCIDILKFDEWLHKKHGNYEDAGQSMDNCIREHYGDEGVKLINRVS